MNKMKSAAWIGLFLLVMPLRAGINYLYEFSGTASDGSSPNGVILSGTTLYGMTHGVTNTGSENGTIFKIETDGSGFTLLHTFAGGVADGKWPEGSLIISGTTLYGMTVYGGRYNKGTIFSIHTDGTGFTLLHEFRGYVDGQWPWGNLTLSGSTLFGMTSRGGTWNSGTIFKIKTNGREFALLHKFDWFRDGGFPRGSLTVSGTTLFGMTEGIYHEASARGTIFRIETNGGGFSVLHEFTGGTADGERPFGSLLLVGSAIYGMTMHGGDQDLGTIFKLEQDGSGFALLHEFTGGHYDGEAPYGSLIHSGSTLYGMTSKGSSRWNGTIFEMQTDGTGFAVLHGFGSGFPMGTPLLHDSTLYGVLNFGGRWGGGVIFSLPLSHCDLDLQVERHEVRAFLIARHYAEIRFLVSPADAPAVQYRILRRDGEGEFFLRMTIFPEELQDGQFRTQDKFLNRDISYTYRVEAVDETGTLLGFSPEKSI